MSPGWWRLHGQRRPILHMMRIHGGAEVAATALRIRPSCCCGVAERAAFACCIYLWPSEDLADASCSVQKTIARASR